MRFEFSAFVAAAVLALSGAGASGGTKDAATKGGYQKGMAPFSIIKGGPMYEAAIGGAKFSYDPL